MTATARIWHPPMIFEFVDHVRSPPAAQLTLSSRHPRREHTDKEREDRLNREAVERWRERQHDKRHKNRINPRSCYTVEVDGDVLDMLMGMGQILDNETGDVKIVGKAISDMLAEAAQAWKVRRRYRPLGPFTFGLAPQIFVIPLQGVGLLCARAPAVSNSINRAGSAKG
jgi:hypothetical protein